MSTVLLFIVGVLVAIIGLAISIALHEIGHLVPAKLFGVRVTQYMIGFGPTLWSKKRGETEYGIKAVPLGGYVAMIGMYPPKHKGEAPREGGTGFINSMIEDAREASAETIPEGEDHRTFYRLPVWKRLIVMLGGPFMNLVIAIVCFMIVLSGFGIYQPTTTINTVSACMYPAGEAPEDPEEYNSCASPAPGAEAGILPGDVVVSMNGQAMADWDEVRETIRANINTPIDVVVLRDGTEMTLQVTPAPNEVYVLDELTEQRVKAEDGSYLTEQVGFVGISPTTERAQQPIGLAFEFAGRNIQAVVNMIITMPQRVVDMWNAGFGGAERDPNSPQSVVGVGRVMGEVAALEEVSVSDRVATMIQLIGSVNIALGIMNLIPLPPLDGGHIVSAMFDGVRRWLAKVFKRPDPGPFDTAKLIPVTLVVAGILLCLMALFVYVDIVNPVRLFG